jgi:hypothetical protein
MMLIGYPQSKNTHNLKVMKKNIQKNENPIEQNFKFSKVFYHM